MTDGEHRVEFHHSLDELKSDMVRLGALVTETIAKSTVALLERDLSVAQQVIDDDDVIDVLGLDIEERCYQLLALQNPIAGDLRFVICTIRMASELERSADLMVNVCKATRRLYDIDIEPRVRGLIDDMSLEAASLTRRAIDSYANADAALASALDDIDDKLDQLHVQYVETIFGADNAPATTLRAAVQLALIGRFYERVGDHAVNMGERVSYMVTGWLPEHSGAARLEARRNAAKEDRWSSPTG
jgi:phosphate transport system protein